jgi:hypothetical protein
VLANWNLSLDAALVGMAEYNERIFDAAYPAPNGDLEQPSYALELAFACFSSGALCFLPAKEAPSPGLNERSLSDPLNAEPDGWLFFAFAEFAWQAARVRTGRSSFWFALAQHFAAMQEVYTWTYGPAVGPRSAGGYARWRRRDGATIPMGEMLELTALYRERYKDRESLAKRLAYNALRSFKDKR